MEITEAMIDAGAKFLREDRATGRMALDLTPWDKTPKATKKKWLALSAGVLRAALAPLPQT